MRTHREFFEDMVGPMADIAFVGCSVTDAAEPPLPTGGATPRRQVVVGGRRVKTVDVHAHCAAPEAMALMGMRMPSEGLDLGPERLRAMDAQGIDVEALSINPYWYTADRDMARQLIRVQNEKLAELCAAQPDRFVAFATVALQHPDLAVEQVEDGIKRLGLCGVSIGGSVDAVGKYVPSYNRLRAQSRTDPSRRASAKYS
jgi:aminocarboxymuconate-semialdehyde decarboxylase